MAIKQKTHMTISMDGHSLSHSRTDIDQDALTIIIDEPPDRGGTGMGPSPTEAAYAALMGCTNVIGHKCADKLGVDIGTLKFRMTIEFDRRGVLLLEEVDVPFTAIYLTVISEGPCSPWDLEKVAAETAKFCPISKLFEKAGTKVNVQWTQPG